MCSLWKILAWVFVACGLVAYIIGWVALFTESTFLGIPNEFWFYDGIATGIFGLFFLIYSVHAVRTKKTRKK